MNFVDYRHDPLPLEDMVRRRLAETDVSAADAAAALAMLGPLGTKREPGAFHRDHSLRVGLLASEIAAHLKLDERALLLAGLLHDVGKALVPACTLGATTKWDATDQAHMEAHVLDGFRLLRDRFDFTAHVIVWHHRFQTRGYPRELPASLQPFSPETLAKAECYGRLLMVADVFDALHRVNSATGGSSLGADEVRARMLKLPDERLIAELYAAGVLR